MRKLCLIVSDSLPMPTSELKYKDTWVYHLRNQFADILDIETNMQRGASVTRLNSSGPGHNGEENLEYIEPDIIIIQHGLPDAAPRLLPRNGVLSRLLNYLPFAKFVYNWLRKHKGRKIEYCDISPEVFEQAYEQYVSRAEAIGTKIIIVELSYATQEVVTHKSPLINKSIDVYNERLHRVVSRHPSAIIIPGLNGSPDLYQSDGLHMNAAGQRVISDNIMSVMVGLLK